MPSFISFTITLAVVASLAWLTYHMVKKFHETEGPFWERIRAGAKDSSVILWSYLLYVAGGLLDLAEQAATVLNMPEVASFIDKLPPKYVAWGLMGIAFINIAARLRTLGR